MNIERGDVFLVDFGERVENSHVHAGRRPAVVVSNNVSNKYSNIVQVCPITTNITQRISHVEISGHTLERNSSVLIEQITTIDKTKLEKHLAHLDKYQMLKISQILLMQIISDL